MDVDSSPGDMEQANPPEPRQLPIERCIQSLVHACQCRKTNCRLSSCQKMKRVVRHTKMCKRKTKGDCPICKQLVALCCYHAKHCQETECSVPFCSIVKQKLKQRQLQQHVQQQQLLRQRLPVSYGLWPGSPLPHKVREVLQQTLNDGVLQNSSLNQIIFPTSQLSYKEVQHRSKL